MIVTDCDVIYKYTNNRQRGWPYCRDSCLGSFVVPELFTNNLINYLCLGCSLSQPVSSCENWHNHLFPRQVPYSSSPVGPDSDSVNSFELKTQRSWSVLRTVYHLRNFYKELIKISLEEERWLCTFLYEINHPFWVRWIRHGVFIRVFFMLVLLVFVMLSYIRQC